MHNIQYIDFKVSDLKKVKILWRKNYDKNMEHMKVHKLETKYLQRRRDARNKIFDL